MGSIFQLETHSMGHQVFTQDFSVFFVVFLEFRRSKTNENVERSLTT